MIRGAVIQLSKSAVDEARLLGRARYENNRQHGVRFNHIDGVNPVSVDIEGVAGELAFAQMLDADTEEIKRIGVTSCEQGTDHGDVVYQGLNIDVKTTRYEAGHLLIYEHKLKNAQVDAYALLTGWRGRYTFRGVISASAVIQGVNEGLFEMKSRDTYWINQEALQDLTCLLS